MFRTPLFPLFIGTTLSLTALAPFAHAEDPTENEEVDPADWHPTPVLIEHTGLVPATIYHNGESVLLESERVSRPLCGSDMSAVTVDDLAVWNAHAAATFADEESYTVFDSTPASRGAGGLNLVFNLSSSVPSAALDAIAEAEAFIESQFGDPITVFINVDFFNFGSGGVIGSASSSYAQVNYPTTRSAMIAGMDGDDVIQSYLPTGSTLPVRYNATSTAITNENRVFFTHANFKATVGSIGGSDANINFNTQFNFDYDPSNGVPFSATCFQSVFIHEVGHALGFTSGAGFRNNDLEALDLFRFARNDTVNGVNGNWNPDTFADFQTQARLVDSDNPGTSSDDFEVDSNSDLISAEYRMSDGFPNQTSHFVEGLDAIMDPTIGGGQTFFPNFFRTPDLAMLDAIGYNYPPSAPTAFGPVAPASGATGVAVKTVFEWEPAVGAANYRLRVDDSPSFASPEIDIMIGGTFTTYTAVAGELMPETPYFWTVDAINSIGTTTISPSSSVFTTTVLAVEPFALLAPDNFATVSTTPTLDWEVAPNATDYRLEVSTAGFFFPLVIDEIVTDSQYTVAPGVLDANDEYFWRVTAMNGSSSIASSPSSRRFTTEETPVNACLADFDNDGDVDLTDFGLFGSAFGSVVGDPNYNPDADFDNDGDVDLTDFGIFGGEFGRIDCLD